MKKGAWDSFKEGFHKGYSEGNRKREKDKGEKKLGINSESLLGDADKGVADDKKPSNKKK